MRYASCIVFAQIATQVFSNLFQQSFYSCAQGLVAYADFKHVFKKSDDELESHIAEGGDSNFESVPPKNIPELCDMRKVGSLCNFNSFYLLFHRIILSVVLIYVYQAVVEEEVALSGALLQHFKVKVILLHSYYTLIQDIIVDCHIAVSLRC